MKSPPIKFDWAGTLWETFPHLDSFATSFEDTVSNVPV
jgi:hypothetical protein